jgi:ABC-type oligopeptide transport system substrate-binding subunit
LNFDAPGCLLPPGNPLCVRHVGRIRGEADEKDRQELLDRQPVGTGPFQLAEYRAGQYIRLQRHEHFWRGTPLMPQVVVDLGSGGTGRLSKLLTGECDVLAWPAASQLTILRDDPRLRLTLRPGMNIAYLAFNTDKPPLNNPAVRHALGAGHQQPAPDAVDLLRYGGNRRLNFTARLVGLRR